MAGARVQDNKTLRIWFSATAPASGTFAPTVAELAAATNLTCDIEKGSGIVGFTDDKTDTASGSICEDSDITTWTGANYGGEHTYFRRFTAGAPATDDVTTTLPVPGTYGYMFVSEGYAYNLTPAVAQKIEVYYVQAGALRRIRGTGANTIRLKQSYFGAGGPSKDSLAILA